MIRDARQAQGIDLASLAAMLKIPLRRLEALENGRHEELQGPTFERALAQAACRVLKIDPKPVLALLPQHERNTLERVTEGINTPFRDGQGSGGFELPTLMRPVVVHRRAAGRWPRSRCSFVPESLGGARRRGRSPAAGAPARRPRRRRPAAAAPAGTPAAPVERPAPAPRRRRARRAGGAGRRRVRARRRRRRPPCRPPPRRASTRCWPTWPRAPSIPLQVIATRRFVGGGGRRAGPFAAVAHRASPANRWASTARCRCA